MTVYHFIVLLYCVLFMLNKNNSTIILYHTIACYASWYISCRCTALYCIILYGIMLVIFFCSALCYAIFCSIPGFTLHYIVTLHIIL